ncbi:MAG: hypothetical protein RMJ56_03435 [Gemmataceae bacterium]|nr:hypothetical protein [Gemmata sp.]MDW8196642.1 hypothetical protein [Gemmataceae bacterium]
MTALFACFPVCLMFVGLTIVAILVVVFGMSNTVTRSPAPAAADATSGGGVPKDTLESPENAPTAAVSTPAEPSSPDAKTASTTTGPPPLGVIVAMALIAFLAALVLMWFGWNEGM